VCAARLVRVSEPLRHLLTLLQEVNFGEIRNLRVQAGQPVFDPPPEVIRFVKLGADNGPRPEMQSAGFTLKQRVLELISELERLGTGRVLRIGVKHGLPTDLVIEHGTAPHDLANGTQRTKSAADPNHRARCRR
jgi:hypothetical protein